MKRSTLNIFAQFIHSTSLVNSTRRSISSGAKNPMSQEHKSGLLSALNEQRRMHRHHKNAMETAEEAIAELESEIKQRERMEHLDAIAASNEIPSIKKSPAAIIMKR